MNLQNKSSAEIKAEAKIAELKAAIAAMEQTAIEKEGPEWQDFRPSIKRAGVVRRAKVAFHHQSNERIADKDLPRLLDIPAELAIWVNQIAKPGERILLQICW